MAIAAGIVLVSLLVAASRTINPVEFAIFSELEQLPDWSARTWQVLTWSGSWPGVVGAAGLALYFGRLRMGASLAAAGATSWVLTLILHWLTVPRPLPTGLVPAVLRQPPTGGFDFPSVHVAVIAALATAASPYLSRFARHGSWLLVVLVGAADAFSGHNLPVGIVAGAALGWGTGALGHLVLGAPGRRTSEVSVRMALDDLGLDGAQIAAVPRRWLRPYAYDITTRSGECMQMKVVRRMHRLAGPAYRLRMVLASFEVEREPRLSTPRHEVEHEAYVTLLAARAGVGTLPVVAAGKIEHGPPFLIRQHVAGVRLSTLRGKQVDDAVLSRTWQDVLVLGEHHVAHHDLRAKNILIDSDGRPRITDFTLSRVGGPPGQLAQAVADMLVTMASVVGVRRAVDSAVREVPTETLQDALPHLQWLALPRRLRRQLVEKQVALAELRATLAEHLGTRLPSFRSPVRPMTVAVTLTAGLAVYLLLPALSSIDQVRNSLGRADWRWMGVAIATGFLGVVASGVSILGSSPRPLPVGKTMVVQLGAAFTGRTTAAGIGFYGINIAYLQRLGLGRANAVGVVLLNRAVVGAITAVAAALGVLVIGSAVPLASVRIPTGWPLILIAAVVLLGAAAFGVSPIGRRRVWRPMATLLHQLARDLLPTLRRPVPALQLLGGSVVFLALQAAGLAATLAAFQPSFPLIPVLAVYVVGSTVGQLAPTPGGLGPVEALTVAGLIAIGVDPTIAVAAVLTSRALTFWLPALAGLVAFRLLHHHDVV